MELKEGISIFSSFLREYYADKLALKAINHDKRVVVDFKLFSSEEVISDPENKLACMIPELGEWLLEDPEVAHRAASIAAREVNIDLPHDFIVRFKNWPVHLTLNDLGALRAKDEGRLVTVQGIIRSKSDLIVEIAEAEFRCRHCSTLQRIPQKTNDKILVKPVRCKCGAKSGFEAIAGAHKLKNTYHITIEEPADEMEGGRSPHHISCLCEEDICSRDIEKALTQGGRVDVTGKVFLYPFFRNGVEMRTHRLMLNSIYIKTYEENFLNIKWTPEEKERFEQISRRPDTLKYMIDNIFFPVKGKGNDNLKFGVMLQMFGGVGRGPEDLADKRGEIHILLVGDPGKGKTMMLNLAKEIHPKAGFVTGGHLSKAGLVGASVKDEIDGKWVYEAGPLILYNNGLLVCDELDKMPKENQPAMNDALQNGMVYIDKATIHRTFRAKTSVLCAANPKHGQFSQFDAKFKQIDIDATVLSRFDLLYFFEQEQSTFEEEKKHAKEIATRHSAAHNITPEFDKQFIRKYIAYAKTIRPIIPDHVTDYIAEQYALLSQAKQKNQNSEASDVPFSPRVLDSFIRLTEAHARVKLRDKATIEDAEIAIDLVKKGFNRLGINTENLGFETYEVEGRVTEYKKIDMKARLERLVRTMTEKEPVHEQEIIEIMKTEGYDPKSVEDYIELLVRKGDIMRPRFGLIKGI